MKAKSNGRSDRAQALPQDANAEECVEFVLNDEVEWDGLENHGDCSANFAEQLAQPAGFTARLPFYGVRARTRRLH